MEIAKVVGFGKEHLEAIELLTRLGGYVVIPAADAGDELKGFLEDLNKTLARVGVVALRCPAWRLDDGSPLCGVERVRFQRAK